MNQNADYSLTFNVNVKDSAWTSENTHTFVTGGDASITKVNGKAPADACGTFPADPGQRVRFLHKDHGDLSSRGNLPDLYEPQRFLSGDVTA